MAFDNLVRPFESFDVTYPRRIFKVDATAPANVVLKIGDSGGGSAKTLSYSRSYSLTTYMKKVQKEVTRPQGDNSSPPPTDPGTQPTTGVPVGGLPR